MRLGESRLREAMRRSSARAGWVVLLATTALACSSTPAPKDEPLDADPPGPVEVGKKQAKRPPELDQGIELVKSGKFADAIPVLKKALDAEPKNAESAFYLGLAIEQSGGDKKEAEALYKQALAFDGNLVEASNNLAAIYLDEPPRPDQAIPVLRKALVNAPDDVSLNTNLGYALGLKGDADGAAKAYDAAIAKGDSPQLRLSYGSMLVENKRAEQAVPHLVKAAEGVDDPASLATIARLLGPGKAFEDCVKVLDRAIAKKGDVAEFYVRRGVCKHELDKEKEASQDFEQAVKLEPNFQAAHYYLGVSLFAQGNAARGKVVLRKAYDLGKETPIGKAAKERLDGKKPGADKKPDGGKKPDAPKK
jgi:Flp pilus assembly protein TadD